MLNLKTLEAKRNCPLMGTLMYESTLSSVNNDLMRNSRLKKIFTEDISKIEDLKDIKLDDLKNTFEDKWFSSIKEQEAFVKKALVIIDRFYMNLNKYKDYDLEQKVEGEVTVGTNDIKLSVDMVLKQSNDVLLLQVRNKQSKLKKGGQKEHTKIQYSLELYTMYLLGQKLYPGKNITAGICYLKEENVKNYIASRQTVSSEESSYFEDKVKELSSITPDNTCDGSNCGNCNYKPLCDYVHNFEKQGDEIAVELEEITTELPKIPFSNEQKEVISFKSGFAVANAVAGAGKTTTMGKRIQRLIEIENIDESEILVLSYSEKSIDEFKENCSVKFGIDNFENAYTFNGFGDKILKENYSLYGYKKSPRLMDNIERLDLVKEVIDLSPEANELDEVKQYWDNCSGLICSRLNYENMFMKLNNNAQGALFQIDKIFSTIKSRGLDYTGSEFMFDEMQVFERSIDGETKIDDMAKDNARRAYKKFLKSIYTMYMKFDYLLKSRGKYVYDDQINCLIDAFSNPRLKDKFRYKHIVCDEFQDSNDCAMYVLKKLTQNKDFESLLVVGDVNQSIYGFQGTTPENLETFEKKLGTYVKKYDLSYSFRVPKIIERTANALMNSSFSTNYNQIKAFKKDEGVIATFPDTKAMLDVIKKGVADGKSIGIITRNNKELNKFINLLIDEDISYVVKSNLYIMTKDKVKNLNSFAKACANPKLHSLDYLKYLQISDNEEFNKHFKKPTFNNYFETKLNEFISEVNTKNPIELMNFYLQKLEELSKKDYMIDAYFKVIQKKRFKTIYDAIDYCNKLEVYSADIKAPENNVESNVILTTAHSSKGREFDIVIMDTSTFTAENEEDRRLFYVAMTRTKHSLYFIALNKSGKTKRRGCSNYLEIISNAI